MGATLSQGLPGGGRAETLPFAMLRLYTWRSLHNPGHFLEKEQRPAIPGLTPYACLNPGGRDGAGALGRAQLP